LKKEQGDILNTLRTPYL